MAGPTGRQIELQDAARLYLAKTQGWPVEGRAIEAQSARVGGERVGRYVIAPEDREAMRHSEEWVRARLADGSLCAWCGNEQVPREYWMTGAALSTVRTGKMLAIDYPPCRRIDHAQAYVDEAELKRHLSHARRATMPARHAAFVADVDADYLARVQHTRKTTGRGPTYQDDIAWGRDRGLKRDRVRALRREVLSAEEKKGGAPPR